MAPEVKQRPTRKGCPNYPIEFKRWLAAAACAADISVAKLALEHGINTNLLFKWRRHYRAGKFGVPGLNGVTAPAVRRAPRLASSAPVGPVKLLPVIEGEPGDGRRDVSSTPPCIEIALAFATVRVHGDVDSAQLRTVLDCLARRS